MVSTRDGPDACEPFEEQARQEERTDDLARDGGLGAVGCDAPVRRECAGVVDQHVEPIVLGEHSAGQLPDLLDSRPCRQRPG